MKRATGWEVGAEGKWRYEEPDFRIIYDEIPEHLVYAAADKRDKAEKERYAASENLWRVYDRRDMLPRRNRTEEQKAEAKALNKEAAKLRKKLHEAAEKYYETYRQWETAAKGYSTVGRLTQDEALFESYPELRNLSVVFKDLPPETHGSTVVSGTTGNIIHIEINNKLTTSEAEKTLAHEIQHCIQMYEGWAAGANYEDFYDGSREQIAARMVRVTGGELTRGGKVEWSTEAMKAALDRPLSDGSGKTIRQVYGAALDALAENFGYNSIDELIEAADEVPSCWREYRRYAGEVEARNAVVRMDYDAERRRNTLAVDTEDISREDQVVVTRQWGDIQPELSSDGDVLYRRGHGAVSDEEVSWANDPVSKALGRMRWSEKRQSEFAARERRRATQRVERAAEALGLDNVEIVQGPVADGRGASDKGWWDAAGDKMVVVISNHESARDAEATLLHEAVGRYGLRKLMGERYDTMLENVLLNADEEVRGRIVAKARDNGWDFADATEEYLGELAGEVDWKGANEKWWQEIREDFTDSMEQIGLQGWHGSRIGDNEMRYLLWRSYTNIEDRGAVEDIFQRAEDITLRRELLGEADNSRNSYNSQRGSVGAAEESTPVGKGAFGNIYDQFRGKVKEAFEFLIKHKSGDLLGVFHRDDVGDIDLVWGDKTGGFAHILDKHVGDGKSFGTVPEAMDAIDDIITTGNVEFENGDKIILRKGDRLVTIRKNYREGGKKKADKNWILTAYDETSADNSASAITVTNQGQAAPTTDVSENKDSAENGDVQENIENNGGEVLYRRWQGSIDGAITRSMVILSQRYKENATLAGDAARAVGGDLSRIRAAMDKQRFIDVSTVNSVAELVQTMMKTGYLGDMNQREISTLLTQVKQSAGKMVRDSATGQLKVSGWSKNYEASVN